MPTRPFFDCDIKRMPTIERSCFIICIDISCMHNTFTSLCIWQSTLILTPLRGHQLPLPYLTHRLHMYATTATLFGLKYNVINNSPALSLITLTNDYNFHTLQLFAVKDCLATQKCYPWHEEGRKHTGSTCFNPLPLKLCNMWPFWENLQWAQLLMN